MQTDLEFKTQHLDTKSASFCAAKWYNATIWLGSGMTTSCHHPLPHKIDVEQLASNPKLLHNTPENSDAKCSAASVQADVSIVGKLKTWEKSS